MLLDCASYLRCYSKPRTQLTTKSGKECWKTLKSSFPNRIRRIQNVSRATWRSLACQTLMFSIVIEKGLESLLWEQSNYIIQGSLPYESMDDDSDESSISEDDDNNIMDDADNTATSDLHRHMILLLSMTFSLTGSHVFLLYFPISIQMISIWHGKWVIVRRRFLTFLITYVAEDYTLAIMQMCTSDL